MESVASGVQSIQFQSTCTAFYSMIGAWQTSRTRDARRTHETRALLTPSADHIKGLNAPRLWHQTTGRCSSLGCAVGSPMTYRFSKEALRVADPSFPKASPLKSDFERGD